MADDKHSTRQVWVDSGLFAQAARGNREAVRALAKNAAYGLIPQHERDELTRWLIECLTRVAAGEAPNRAFGWTVGNRPPINRELLHWTLARHVADLIDGGYSRKDALEKVGTAARMDGSKGGRLEGIYDQYKAVAPEDLEWTPLPPDFAATVAGIEDRLSIILASEPPN
jgi:hypothetical protein